MLASGHFSSKYALNACWVRACTHRYGDAHYNAATWRKVTVVEQIVSWGFNIIHSDVDVVRGRLLLCSFDSCWSGRSHVFNPLHGVHCLCMLGRSASKHVRSSRQLVVV
jgi:hypothetical protein